MRRLYPALLITLMVTILWCGVFVAIIAQTVPVPDKARNQWLLKLAVLEYQEDRDAR